MQELTIRRQPPASQNVPDAGIAAVIDELKTLPRPTTAAAVATALSPHHASVTIVPALVWYSYEEQPPGSGYWVKVCHDHSAVVVIDSQTERPIEVGIDDLMKV